MTDSVPGWHFVVQEVSAGHHVAEGRDAEGRSVSVSGGDDALEKAVEHARSVCLLHEFDMVEVVEFDGVVHSSIGVGGSGQAPRVGDIATVVDMPGHLADRLTVECVDSRGRTRWLAGFERRQLRFISRPA